MPAIQVIETDAGTLGIWKLTDSVKDLLTAFQFSKAEKEQFAAIKIERRQREFLSVRLLLLHITGTKYEIVYDRDGRPSVENGGYYLAVSHSADLVTVLISHHCVGVDVEQMGRDTSRVAYRFLSEDEMHFIGKSDGPALMRVTCWCAKEAAFKYSSEQAVDFKNHIALSPFTIESKEGWFFGELKKAIPAEELAFHYLFYENNVIVSCVKKEII